MKKFLLITVVVILLVIIGLFAFISYYVTPERVKEFVIPTAEASLNRKVSIGEININLLKGIGIQDFAIKEADEKTDFIKCRDFVLKFKLLPLLTKKVIIDELKLVSPEILVKRTRNGKFNFEDIGRKEDVKEEVEEQVKEPEGLPISLLVNRIAIKDARFSLSDLMGELPDVNSSVNVDTSIESINGSELYTKGRIDVTLDRVVIKKPSKKEIENLNAGLRYAVHINLESLDIRIEKADLTIQEIPASITGEIKKVKTSPEVDMALSLPRGNTAKILKALAPFAEIKGLGLSGDIAAEVKLKGMPQKIDTMKAKGNIMMDQVGIVYNDIDAIVDGDIQLNEKLINVNLKSTLGKNTAEIKGSVSNYFKNQNISLNIYAKKLFLDELMPEAKNGETPPSAGKAKPAPEKSEKEAEPVDLKITANGEIRVDSALYKGMTMNDFLTKFEFKNNRLNISEMTAKAGKGKFNLNSLIDLSRRGYTYNLSSNLDSLHADEVVNALFPKAKETVFGILSFDLNLNGSGTVPKNAKKNLTGSVNFNIQEGRITNARITDNLSRFLDIKELKTINLKQAEGNVMIKNGIAKLNSIFTSEDISMNPSGNIGLDETLDLKFDLKLSPRLTDKAVSEKISKYMKSEEGWGIIPLKVTGTFADPSYTVDVAKAGKQVIEKEADKLIDKLFDKKDEEEKKELEPAKDLLKQLFK